MEADLVSLLTSSSTITDIVANRISWNVHPQGDDEPSLVIHRVAGAPGYHMQGEDGLDQAVVQIDCRSTVSLAQAASLRDAVKALLSGYSGTVGATKFQGIFWRAERHTATQPSGTDLYHMIQLDWDVISRAAA